MVIDGPMDASRLPMTGAWNVCVSVRARTLAMLAGSLKPGHTITLTFLDGVFVIDEGEYILPAKISAVPPARSAWGPQKIPCGGNFG